MNRQQITAQLREGAVRIREWLRRHVTRRRVILATAGGVLLLGLGVWVEALVRVRLVGPADRLPTALYTRPEGWRGTASPELIGGIAGGPAEYRVPVALDALPPHLVDAVLAVEDQRFHQHHGLDYRRIAGALVANIKAGGISQGGSTITQQLAKNLFLSARRTPLRKLREAAMAVVLEVRYDKARILEAYLNEIYLGQDNGAAIHGVGAAAQYYFGKEVRRVVLSEAATLAAMIQAPNRLSPVRRPEELRARRNLVLQLMADQGRISSRSQQQSARVTVPTRVHPRRGLDARWFRDFVVTEAPRGLPARGAAIYTTIDPSLQRAAVDAVRRGLAQTGDPRAQAALVAIDPRNGDVLAMVGGRDYGASQFNRAVQARRQPGSAFKPIVALAALERPRSGEPAYTLATAIADEPLAVRSGGELWQPANYDGAFRGEVTLREAMEQSLNVPFARVGMTLGPERIAETARRLGIVAPMRPVPALALGASELSLLELVRAYGVFATGGELADSRVILATQRGAARSDAPGEPQLRRVADPAATFLVTSALQGAVERGTGQRLGRGGIAGKTGTSNDWRDAWFVAYTPELVVGVWVGHDDSRSLRRTGGAVAVPIVARFLEQARIRGGGFTVPDGIVEGRVGGSGGWFGDCGYPEYFLAGTAPQSRFCWQLDLAGFQERIERVGRPERRDRATPRPRAEGRWDERELLRQAERWLREQAGVELERLLRAAERQVARLRLR